MKEHDLLTCGPDDPDVVLVVDYLDGRLSPADREAVIDRLCSDPAFFRKVCPIIEVWTAPVDWRALLDETEDAGRARSAGVAESGARPAPATPATRVTLHAEPAAKPRRRSWIRRHARRLAAALLLVVVVPMVGGMTACNIGAGAAHELAQRDSLPAVPTGATRIVTGQGERRTVTLPGGTTFALGPMSRLTWRIQQGWPHGIVASLKGEAVIEVSDADDLLFLGTMAGSAVMMRGTYAVRCEIGCTTMRVTVGESGVAWLKGVTATDWTYWPLRSREHGETTPFEPPVKTAGGDSYPVAP